jgi:hypothetical protein
MMIEAFKLQEGEALGANKVGEESGENEGKIGDIPEPPKTLHKNVFVPVDTFYLCFLSLTFIGKIIKI